MISETPADDAYAQSFKSASLVPPSFTQSMFNSVKEGFYTGDKAINVLQSSSELGKPNEHVDALWDTIQNENAKESQLLSIPQKVSRYPLEFIGSAIGMAFNPITYPFVASGGVATEGLSRAALNFFPEIGQLARKSITSLVGTQAGKYLPESLGELAANAKHGASGFAGVAVPNAIINNYNADTKSISWGGVTEEVGINGAIGALLSIPGYAAGVAFKKILSPDESVPMPNTPEGNNMSVRLDQALAEKRITKDEYDYGKMLYEGPHNPELVSKASKLMIDKGMPINTAKAKAFFSMVDENTWDNLKSTFAEQLNNANESTDKKALSDFIFGNSLDKLRDQPEHVDGLRGAKEELDYKLANREEKLQEMDKIVDEHLHTGLTERMPFDQHDIYEQVKNNPTEHLPYTVPEDVKNKINNEEVNLKSPQEELSHIRNSLINEKGLSKNWQRSKEYGRLVDLADVWHNAQTLLDRVNLEADYNKSDAYRNIIGNYLKVLDSQIEKFSDVGRVQRYLKQKIDKAAGIDGEYKESYEAEKTPEEVIRAANTEPTDAGSFINDFDEQVENVKGQKNLKNDYKDLSKRYKQFKKGLSALKDMMDCFGAKE